MLSVIVPVYNSEKTVLKCLKSILLQSYKNIEVIVIDDGSTDFSGKICRSLADKDSRVKYFYKENTGVSAARNMGINYSSGDFIAFVDSDDSVHPSIYVEMIDSIRVNDLVSCSLALNGVPLGKSKYKSRDCVHSILLDKNCSGYACNKVFRKDIIINNKISFDESIYMCEDKLFCLEYAAYVKRFVSLDSVLYNYDLSADSMTNSVINMKKLTIINSYKKAIQIVKPEYKNIVKNQLTRVLLANYRALVKSKSGSVEFDIVYNELSVFNKDFLLDKTIPLKYRVLYSIFLIKPSMLAYI